MKISDQPNLSFQEALDIIEAFPHEQQESLIDLIRRRLVEQRRRELARHIHTARKEYAQGKVKRGEVKDLLKELAS